MTVAKFVNRQIDEIQRGGRSAALRKMLRLLEWATAAIPAVFVVFVVRAIRPWLLVRFCGMSSDHLGHFAGDTELYLCQRDARIDVPARRHVDVFFIGERPVSNQQLARMWRRVLRIGPAWLLTPVVALNRLIPGADLHHLEHPDRDSDFQNLLDRSPPHLHFTDDEVSRGQAGLRAMGIPTGVPYVCLIARDNAYFQKQWPRHDLDPDNYRNCDIQSFAAAVEELAGRGYFVVRMGASVQEPLRVANPRVLDYATNGMRSDFMDIYLGATCAFCVTSSTGFDAVPRVFRRPVVFVNIVQWIGIAAASATFISITKHYYSMRAKRELALTEVLALGSRYFEQAGPPDVRDVQLVDNTPDEIRDIVIEMAERLNGTWQPERDDDLLQKRFWELFPAAGEYRIRGEIRGRFGAVYLRNNRAWLR